MTRFFRAPVAVAVLVCAQLGLAACSVEVNKNDRDNTADVKVRTPGADVSVKGGIDTPDTGLAVYPGATPARGDEDRKEAADVNVSVPFVNVHVVAAKYNSDDAPEKLLDFYRGEMKKFGDVMECTGDIDFKSGRMTCRHRLGHGAETQLGVGTEHRHRLVVVKPRGTGSELSLASVETGNS